MSDRNRPSPPEELVDALQDRVHPASGRLLSATKLERRTRGTVTRELTVHLDDERWHRLERIAEKSDVEPISVIGSVINAILNADTNYRAVYHRAVYLDASRLERLRLAADECGMKDDELLQSVVSSAIDKLHAGRLRRQSHQECGPSR